MEQFQNILLESSIFLVLGGVMPLQETNSLRALVHYTTHSLGTKCSKTKQD